MVGTFATFFEGTLRWSPDSALVVYETCPHPTTLWPSHCAVIVATQWLHGTTDSFEIPTYHPAHPIDWCVCATSPGTHSSHVRCLKIVVFSCHKWVCCLCQDPGKINHRNPEPSQPKSLFYVVLCVNWPIFLLFPTLTMGSVFWHMTWATDCSCIIIQSADADTSNWSCIRIPWRGLAGLMCLWLYLIICMHVWSFGFQQSSLIGGNGRNGRYQSYPSPSFVSVYLMYYINFIYWYDVWCCTIPIYLISESAVSHQ